ncbi:MAG TPA: MFS transporter [Gemmatimonadales bacterium]|nr:MFS transporter [Gemmatimonadales bacterium]
MTAAPTERRAAIRFIVCLGVVSLFADMTYEGAHSAVGPLLQHLGASAAAVGLAAGFGEMIAASLRYFSGKLADRTRAYWPITFAGYGVNLIVVPALAFAGTWQAAALLVIAERTGKSLRGPARDVLLSEATDVVGHGWGFGLHAAFDQTGAVIGPLLVAVAVARSHQFGPAFLWLGVPALLTLVALAFARLARPNRGTPPPTKGPQELPSIYWSYVVGAGLLAAGFVDFPLLAFHFQKTALFPAATIPLLYAGAMAVNGITALVYGRLFDRFGVAVLAWGILVSLLALPFGFLLGQTGGIIGIGCWAAGLGVQDASLRSGIAQVVSMNKRGNAFGIFNGVYGVMWFLGSAVMGLLYDHSIIALVVFGVAIQVAASVVFFRLRPKLAAA